MTIVPAFIGPPVVLLRPLPELHRRSSEGHKKAAVHLNRCSLLNDSCIFSGLCYYNSRGNLRYFGGGALFFISEDITKRKRKAVMQMQDS